MKTLAILLLSLFSKPNEVREYTHINGNNFVKTEIIILHSQKVMFIPDTKGITQRYQFEDLGNNTYKLEDGAITFSRKGAIMRLNNEFIEFTNHRYGKASNLDRSGSI